MSDDLEAILMQIKAERERHRANLEKWKQAGGRLENYPEHETIDDMIARETTAVENLTKAIDRLKKISI